MTTRTTTVPRIATPAPVEAPMRRLHPDELCPNQKERVVRTIRRDI